VESLQTLQLLLKQPDELLHKIHAGKAKKNNNNKIIGFKSKEKKKRKRKEKRYFAQQRVHLTKKEGIFNSFAKQIDTYQCRSMGRGRGACPPPPPIIWTGTFNLVSHHALPAAFRFNVFILVRN